MFKKRHVIPDPPQTADTNNSGDTDQSSDIPLAREFNGMVHAAGSMVHSMITEGERLGRIRSPVIEDIHLPNHESERLAELKMRKWLREGKFRK